jgi:hypothetical protein
MRGRRLLMTNLVMDRTTISPSIGEFSYEVRFPHCVLRDEMPR